MPTPKYAGVAVPGVHSGMAVFPGGPGGYPFRSRDGVVPATKRAEYAGMVREYDAGAEVFKTHDADSFARYRLYRDLCLNGVVRPIVHEMQPDPANGGWLIFCEWAVPYETTPTRRHRY